MTRPTFRCFSTNEQKDEDRNKVRILRRKEREEALKR
jgi:hypothetical protein